jgi:hypothetical protein
MENISEKRSRGRPRKLPPQQWALLYGDVALEAKTHRSKMNALYHAHAVGQFHDDPRFEWLLSDDATIKSGKGHMRNVILQELGRIENETERAEVALFLCEQKPTVREAVSIIRRFRLGRLPQGTPEQLADVLRKALNEYVSTHEGITYDEMRAALSQLRADIDATESR